MEQQINEPSQLIDLCDDIISMFDNTNDSVAGLTDIEKYSVAESAANIIIKDAINKIKTLDNYLKIN